MRFANIQVYRRPQQLFTNEQMLAFARGIDQLNLPHDILLEIRDRFPNVVFLLRENTYTYQVPITRLRPYTDTDTVFVERNYQNLPIMDTELPGGGIRGDATNTQLNVHHRPEQEQPPRTRRRICATDRV